MVVYNVHIIIRKGLGPEFKEKIIPVGIDDIPDDMTEFEMRQYAKQEAERELYNSIDYKDYGKNWQVIDIISA